MSDIVVVDSGQTYETTESAIVVKEEADRAEKWAKYSEEKANLSEQSAIEAAKSKDDAKAEADRAQDIVNDFNTNASEKQAQFDVNAVQKTNDFNQNASDKKAEVDASAENARKWAVGTIEEQPAGSSKYWAGQAAASAASVDGEKIKRIAYENFREIECSGSVKVTLQNTDEVIALNVTNNATITIDVSALTFPKPFYTVQIYAVFPNGAKTISFSATPSILWLNNTVPDFSSTHPHWLVLRYLPNDTFVLMSDAGEVG